MHTVTLTRTLARSSIAPVFLTDGIDAVRSPNAQAVHDDVVTRPLAEMLGMQDNPARVVRLMGGVQLVAGTLLIFGKAPRLSSSVLAATLVPTTLSRYRFWEVDDPTVRAQQRNAFLKNCAMVGGLMLAAVDKNGAPSLGWRTKRAARHLGDVASDTLSSAGSAVSVQKPAIRSLEKRARKAASRSRQGASKAVDQFSSAGSDYSTRAMEFGKDRLVPLGKDASKSARRLRGEALKTASHVSRDAGKNARSLSHSLADTLSDAANTASDRMAHLMER